MKASSILARLGLAFLFMMAMPPLHAEMTETERAALLKRIKVLEDQNAKLAVDATRAKMEAEDYRQRYQTAVSAPESPSEDLEKVKSKLWKAEVALGATASSGNSNAYQVNLAAKGTRTTKLDELILALTADVGESEGVKVSEKGKASVNYRRDIDNDSKWYWLLGADLERDQLSDLDYRLTGGPGAGYHFWKTEKFKLDLESGPVFVAEKNSEDSVDYSIQGRIGNRLEYKVAKYAKLFQNSEILFNFQDNEDYLVNNELGVESSITKTLSLRIFGKHRYDHLPAAGKEENDFSLISALVYKFE